MNIKERLEQLDYSDAYDLWSVWILGNQEPPDKWLIVHELSDLAAMDAIAAAELSDEIDKLLAEDENAIRCVDCGCEISSGLLCLACGTREVTFAEAGTDLMDEETSDKTESPITMGVLGETSDNCIRLYQSGFPIIEVYRKVDENGKPIESDNEVENRAKKICGLWDESTPDSPIIVSIRGGCIYAVDNVPDDKIVEVHDYDIDGSEDDKLLTDDDGEQYILSIY